MEKENQLAVIVKESNLEPTKAKKGVINGR